MNNIYLAGFMGTGKTVVGKALARRLNFTFVDIDNLIVQKEKRAISDIFAREGEVYFRGIEKEMLKTVAEFSRQVVSCGGGIVINPQNIEIMKNAGSVFVLTASVDVIIERTKKSTHRPLLNVTDPKAKITELLKSREAYYNQANFKIDTSDLTVAQVVEKIIEKLSSVSKRKK